MAKQDELAKETWLLQCLEANLSSTDPATRNAAEGSLRQSYERPGFAPALANIAVARHLEPGLRQLAAVVLKQFVKEQWPGPEELASPSNVSPEDKAAVREVLPTGLADPEQKVRTAVGMAVAAVAMIDWPQDWPELMPFLLRTLSSHSDPSAVAGAVRCLALFCDDIDDKQLPSLLPSLVPALYNIVVNAQAYEPYVRRRALHILHSCFGTLGFMDGAFQAETRNLMQPMLPPWMALFGVLLGTPLPAESPDDWGLRMEVIKCLQQVVLCFAKQAEAYLPALLGPLWQTFVSGIPVYEVAAVRGEQEAFDSLADEDGGNQGLSALMMQLFEFLLTLVGNKRFQRAVENSCEALAYFTIAYMQLTEEQVLTWEQDANQYVADEDDSNFTCRISGAMLLELMVEEFEEGAIGAICVAASRRLQEATSLKAKGQADFWKLREATILSLGCIAEPLLKAKQDDLKGFNVVQFLNGILQEDLSPGSPAVPYLQGRGLWAFAKFSSGIQKENVAPFLLSAVLALSSAQSPVPVKIGGCRALSELYRKLDAEFLRPSLPAVYNGLGTLLQEATEETMHLVLETLTAVVKADVQTAAAMEAVVSPAVLHVWSQHITDPVISEDAAEVLEAIANAPGCLTPLLGRVVPALVTICSKPKEQREGLVAGALELLTTLLKCVQKAGQPEAARPAFEALFEPIARIVLQSDDDAELQNGTEALAAFVRCGGGLILEWSTAPPGAMRTLLDCAARLLDPALDESSAFCVGALAVQLATRLPGQLAPHLRGLLGALAARLAAATMPTLTSSLLVVFARLVHMSGADVGQLIGLLADLPAEGGRSSALALVMAEWCKNQGTVMGSHAIKVTTAALGLLLSSGDPRLDAVQVQGYPVRAHEGIVTRSRARSVAEQWTTVPLPAKLLSLLAEKLIEDKELKEVDEEWEEDDEEDLEEAAEARAAAGQALGGSGTEAFEQLARAEELHLGDAAGSDSEIDDIDGSGAGGVVDDPLREVDLTALIAQIVRELATRRRAWFESLLQSLQEREKAAINVYYAQVQN